MRKRLRESGRTQREGVTHARTVVFVVFKVFVYKVEHLFKYFDVTQTHTETDRQASVRFDRYFTLVFSKEVS